MDITVEKLDTDILAGPLVHYRAWLGNRSGSYFSDLLEEQNAGKRQVLLAFIGADIAGHVTVKWRSEYPQFAARDIPEINDLWVLASFRRNGVATALLDEAERIIFERSPLAGIGVGMYSDYGPAQRLYVLRGYVPDGHGLYSHNHPVVPGREVFVDDDLVLYFTRDRPPVL